MLFAPAKAANAGGVATSALEMSQNCHAPLLDLRGGGPEAQGHHGRTSTTTPPTRRREVRHARATYVAGANIAGFIKVADAMLAQGVI